MFEIYSVPVKDVSFVKEYKTLALGWFKNNGITDVSPLSDYNPESLIELDFTGNLITDWSALEPIKHKVYVHYDVNTGIAVTLADKIESDANKEAQGDAELDEEIILTDENGNPVDFGSLFD